MAETELADGYHEQISYQTITEDDYVQMPLRRQMLVELEDKLDVRIPATRKYGEKAYSGGTVYLTNEDLVTITKGVLAQLDAEPIHPSVALRDDDGSERSDRDL